MAVPDMPREAARVYAHNLGWAILAIWPPDEGHCTCPNPYCDSPGKHPHQWSHSVKGATTDLEEIEAWPTDVNIGVALGQASGGLMVLDIDQPEVADLVLANSEFIKGTVVSKTARGSHVYFLCTGDTTGFNLTDANDEHLGEVRGDGQYVVLPPSLHPSGIRYEWVTLEQLEQVEDAQETIKAIFAAADVEPKFSASEFLDVPDVGVEAMALPEALKGGATDSQLSDLAFGPYTSIDLPAKRRSHFLYQSAMQIAEAYDRADIAADAEVIAANLRWLHDKLNMRKYSGPKEFMRLALKAKGKTDVRVESTGVTDRSEAQDSTETIETAADTDSTAATDPSEAADSTETSDIPFTTDQQPVIFHSPVDGEFRWSEEDGKLYTYRKFGNAKTPTAHEVCNFHPILVKEFTIDDAETQTRSWLVRLEQDGVDPHEVVWHAEDRQPARAGATLSDLPMEFIVRPKMHDQLFAATASLGRDTAERTHEYATTGWVTHHDRPVYLLPSMEGAIGADGIDPTLRINSDHLPDTAGAVSSAELAPYGRGVRPPETDDEKHRAIEAFLAMINVVEPDHTGKTMAIALQILAGSLIPAGAGETPPLLHVRGGTGTYKTSFSTVALSMFGTWIRDLTPPPSTWHSTPTFLQAMLHGTKDLTLLIDDYKYGVVTNHTQVNRMVQQYADRTARGRANTRGGVTTSRLPRGLIVSNGEDVWGDSVASGEARTIEFIFGKDEIKLDRLDVAQRAVSEGSLQLFGGAWLQWLASNWERIFDERIITKRRDEWRDAVAKDHVDAHMRVVTQVSVLAAVGTLLAEFVRETWPEYGDVVTDAAKASARMLIGGVDERAELVREAAPFRQLAVALNEAVTAGEALFKNRGHTLQSEQEHTIPSNLMRAAPVVGYHWLEGDERMVLLTEGTSMKFFRNLGRSTSLPPNFNWKSVMLDAIENHDGQRAKRERVSPDRSGKKSQLSGVIVQLDRIQNAHSDDDSDEGVT